MYFLKSAGLIFLVLPCAHMLRCHFGHHLTYDDNVKENGMTMIECVEEDVFCLKAEAVTTWYRLFEGEKYFKVLEQKNGTIGIALSKKQEPE